MVLLQSYVFVWTVSPGVFCRLSPFKVMFLCGALPQRCSVVGPPSKIMFLCEALAQGYSVEMILLHRYAFV